MYEIKKGVEIPPRERKSGTKSKYPFAQMAIGDCFDVPISERGAAKTQSAIHSASRAYGLMNEPIRIRTHRLGDSIRVWRV